MKKKYSYSMDEMIKKIQEYLKNNPDDIEYIDVNNPYYKEGYRKALEDFLFIVS